MTVRRDCDGCGVAIDGEDVDGYVDAYAAHVAESHADWGYTDKAVRAYVRRWFTSDVGGDGGTGGE